MILEKFISLDTSIPVIIILVLAGLGLFLYGINTMSSSLKSLAGNRLKMIIEKSTDNPFKGILVGIVITVLIQSSSGTTALVVGLVSAGLMSLPAAIGVIMGSNIGTTLTTVIIGLPIADYLMIFAGIGAFIFFFAKKKKTKEIGTALFGFGLLFLGLNLMSGSLNVIFTNYKETAESIFAQFSEIPILGLLVGTIFTALIQSSAAAIGILQTLFDAEIIGLTGALAILIGSNIGTTITAVISAIGTSTNAKRTAAVHTMFNVFGAVIFMILLIPMVNYKGEWMGIYTACVQWISDVTHINAALTISVGHIIFNVISTFVLFFFRNQMASLACKIIKSKEEVNPLLQGLDDYSLCKKSPSLALEFVSKALNHMGNIVSQYFELTKTYSFANVPEGATKSEEYERDINLLDKKIHDYLIQITQSSITKEESNIISKYLDTVKDLERIGDHLKNICEFFEVRYNEKLTLSEEGTKDLANMYEILDGMVNNALTAISSWDKTLAIKVVEAEETVDSLEQKYRKRHVKRLNEGVCTVSNFDYYVDILSNLERIGDHSDNIANNVINDEYLEFEVYDH